MDKQTKVLVAILAIFVIGMTMSVAFADPVSAAKYKGKKSITVKVKDGKKTIKIKCKYKSGYYYGKKGKYFAEIWKGPSQSPVYRGWNTKAVKTTNHKYCERVGHKKPITTLKIHF